MRRVTRIKGLSESRRLPRLGKIRLGIKKKTAAGKEYPAETDYFVCPDEVKDVYGEEPKELDIMFPVEDLDIVFPQAYEMYGSGKGMKCTGDGEVAWRVNEETGEMEERTCPCEFLTGKKPKCSQRAHLSVLLPNVSVGGVYQIDTSSYNSIVDLNSSIEFARALIGRLAMVPLKLKREPRDTHHAGKKQVHHTMRIEFKGDVEFLNQLKRDSSAVLTGPQLTIAPPLHENPASGPVDEFDAPEPDDKPLEGELEQTNEDNPPIDLQVFLDILKEAKNIDDLRKISDRVPELNTTDRPKAAKSLGDKFKELNGGIRQRVVNK